MVTKRKYNGSWKIQEGLDRVAAPFHLWNENQLQFILKNWGKVIEVDGDTLQLIDLTKVKVKVEMDPNMVLLALLEVIDGA